jgi:hypothetical protein
MAETMGSVVKRVVLADMRIGLQVTDAQAREAIARQNNDYVRNTFNPIMPVPDVSSETIDRYAESLLAT